MKSLIAVAVLVTLAACHRDEVCGDGVDNDDDGLVDCDDANCFFDDACDDCGNGVVDANEACDDAADPERCAGCFLIDCGNGVVDDGEDCDHGPRGDRFCTDTCTFVCGNLLIEGNEECDDANDVDNDHCTRCRWNVCGDGVVNELPQLFGFVEECDDANDDPLDGCHQCVRVECGDGRTTGLEECDDAQDAECDGCVSHVCGNNRRDLDEVCDGTDVAAGLVCASNCTLCGNNIVDEGEECDEVSISCRGCVIAFCGDGVRDRYLDEECDDGNDSELDNCLNDCRRPYCGDGRIDAAGGEICEDEPWCFRRGRRDCTNPPEVEIRDEAGNAFWLGHLLAHRSFGGRTTFVSRASGNAVMMVETSASDASVLGSRLHSVDDLPTAIFVGTPETHIGFGWAGTTTLALEVDVGDRVELGLRTREHAGAVTSAVAVDADGNEHGDVLLALAEGGIVRMSDPLGPLPYEERINNVAVVATLQVETRADGAMRVWALVDDHVAIVDAHSGAISAPLFEGAAQLFTIADDAGGAVYVQDFSGALLRRTQQGFVEVVGGLPLVPLALFNAGDDDDIDVAYIDAGLIVFRRSSTGYQPMTSDLMPRARLISAGAMPFAARNGVVVVDTHTRLLTFPGRPAP